MKKKVFNLILVFLVFPAFLFGFSLTNKATLYWSDSFSGTHSWSNSASTNVDFYKFTLTSPGYNQYVLSATTLHIPFTIQNVGSINETNGIHFSAFFDTNFGQITITSNSNTGLLTNISSLSSGNYFYYSANVTLFSNVPEGTYMYYITNVSLSSGHPLRVIYSNSVQVYMQSVTVYSAYDGVHSITAFDGSGLLGDIDVTVSIGFEHPPHSAYLYYDVDADPDGSLPDGTVNKNRRVPIVSDGDLYKAVIPISDPEIKEGKQVRFIIVPDGHPYYYASSVPFAYSVKYYAQQSDAKEPVIITRNVGNIAETPTHLIYTLKRNSFVNVTVYNLRGEVIRVLRNDVLLAGKHVDVWDGKNAAGMETAPGLYFIHINCNEYGATKKVLFIKR